MKRASIHLHRSSRGNEALIMLSSSRQVRGNLTTHNGPCSQLRVMAENSAPTSSPSADPSTRESTFPSQPIEMINSANRNITAFARLEPVIPAIPPNSTSVPLFPSAGNFHSFHQKSPAISSISINFHCLHFTQANAPLCLTRPFRNPFVFGICFWSLPPLPC